MNNNIMIAVGAGILGIVIGVIGVLAYQKSTGQMANTIVPTQDEMQQASEDVMQVASEAAAAVTPEWKINLTAQNGSGENGFVTLDDENGKTRVLISLTASSSGTLYPNQPAHIHIGACPTPGAVKFPLSNVVNGASETVIDASIDDLKQMLPLAINVHKSASESSVYTACGDLK